MKIGYPCINRTVGCSSGRTFRLKSYSEERLVEKVQGNLNCLFEILKWNRVHDILFFRITSDLVPFASHPVNQFDWAGYFKADFRRIGDYIIHNEMRISMHPDQFVLINSPDKDVSARSRAELIYHAQVLDAMGLDLSARIQIHVGGVYSDKPESMKRFIRRFEVLPLEVKRRLVIENDDRLYTLSDCLSIGAEIGIPVLFDSFHHQLNSSGQSLPRALDLSSATWKATDGLPMVDYSFQRPSSRRGNHAETLDVPGFADFLKMSSDHDFDLMLEIKDKETSALASFEAAFDDPRVWPVSLRLSDTSLLC